MIDYIHPISKLSAYEAIVLMNIESFIKIFVYDEQVYCKYLMSVYGLGEDKKEKVMSAIHACIEIIKGE